MLSPLHAAEDKAKPKKKAKGGRPAPVVIAEAQLRQLAPLTWVSGTVISRNDARLSTEVEGQLKKVAEVGRRVKEDEIVARIDSTFIKLRIEELKASVESEKAQLHFLRQEVQRLKRLAKQNNAAQTRLEQTVADREIASNKLNIAKTRLQQAKEELWRHMIRAPFPGVISERLKHPGERAETGDDIVRLVDPDSLEVQARAPLSAVNYVDQGTKVDIKRGVRDDQVYAANIRALVPVGDERSRMMDLRLDYPDNGWRVGQSVRVALPTAKPRQVIAIPRDALVLRRDGASVFRLKQDDTAEKVRIQVGMASGDYIEVMGKIQAGDRVVIRGGERLRPGQKVMILPNPAEQTPGQPTSARQASLNVAAQE